MKDEQDLLDEQMDRKLEAQMEAAEEMAMHRDENHCFLQLADDAIEAINQLGKDMLGYGHELSYAEIIAKLEEV